MTRRNLAMRRNANTDSGSSVTIINTDWGSSGWGLRLTTPGSNGFAVGSVLNLGVQPNTAYSVSFRAKVVSGSSAALIIDFWPDTLPETSRSITATDTLYKWENVSSSSADWNGARLRFFSNTNGVVIEVTDIKVEQNTIATDFVVAPDDAQFFATAAAGSAQSASASATGAANSASAASSSATAAASSAGSASTSAGQASTSATNAANSASAAATHYTNTVSATGSLTSSVSTLSTTVSTLQGTVNTASAQYVLKVGVTRSDGKQVFAGMGLASTSNGSISQSEILLQADRLVFVPSGTPDATPKQMLVVGTVGGVATLVVNAAMIGDATIGSAQVGSLTADKIQLNAGTFNVLRAPAGGAAFNQLSAALGAGGSYSNMDIGGNITYIGLATYRGVSLGNLVLPYPGQMIDASVNGYVDLVMGSNWGGPAANTQHTLRVYITLRMLKNNAGSWTEVQTFVDFDDDRLYYMTVNKRVRIPFFISDSIASAGAGTYDFVLGVNVLAYQGDTATSLYCLNPTASRCFYRFRAFANSV